MGYRLEVVKGSQTPYDDPITLTGMDRLIAAAEHAGVELDKVQFRSWAPGDNKRSSKAASLRRSFSSNDGLWVRPEESKELAQKLGKVAWASEDPPFIAEMADYFGFAAKNGGFYVW